MELPSQPSFHDWVKHIFDHEVPEDAKQRWYYNFETNFRSTWDDPLKELEYLTQTFEQIDLIAESYTDKQMNQALWYLVNEFFHYYIFDAVEKNEISNELLDRTVGSIFTVYERLFLPKCTSHLCHLMRERDSSMNPLNSICYMWWDIFPTWGQPDNEAYHQRDQLLLNVMRRTLDLDSDACREGALHGLGHWAFEYEEEVQQIIDDFLLVHPHLRPELIEYAQNARRGNVL